MAPEAQQRKKSEAKWLAANARLLRKQRLEDSPRSGRQRAHLRSRNQGAGQSNRAALLRNLAKPRRWRNTGSTQGARKNFGEGCQLGEEEVKLKSKVSPPPRDLRREGPLPQWMRATL